MYAVARRKTLAQRAEKPGSYSAKRGMSNKEGEGAIPNDAPRGSFEGSNLQIYYYTSFKMMFFPGSSLYAKYVEFLNQRTLCIWF